MRVWSSRSLVAIMCLAALAAGYFGGRPLLERVEFARAESAVESSRQQLSTADDLSTVFRHVGKVVEPSVVEIKVKKTVKESDDQDQNDQLRKFFHDHGLPDMAPPDDQPQEEIGTGSGVIMESADGYGFILTNNHVAGDADEMVVTLADGRVIRGTDVKLMGADPKSDLACVRIKADRLIPAVWGNSDELEKGDWIMAFGAPFGYVGSMTHGIVSALNRSNVGIINNGQGYENFIQVDAPINPGNSGGPLVNIHGEVVGINTAIATRSGGFQGIGFAIPSNQAKPVFEQLKISGSVVRGWLGISLHDVADELDLAQSFGYDGDHGVIVHDVGPTSPAAGKLQDGDIIIGYNGQDIADGQQLKNVVAATTPNTKVTIRVFRDGKAQDVDVVIGTQPRDMEAALDPNAPPTATNAPAAAQPSAVLGLTLSDLDQPTADKLALRDGGALVTDVDQKSDAAKAGLRAGDVITQVFRTPIHNAKDAADALQNVDVKKGVRLYVVTRDDQSGHIISRFVFIKSGDTSLDQ
jgi:serine protease Do